MAIAHLCSQCGRELARVRPVREAHYGLRIIRCPACRTVTVRRPPPLLRAWRFVLRLKTSVILMLLQVVCAFALMVATQAAIETMSDQIRRSNGGGLAAVDRELWILVGGIAVLTGAWLTAGLAHWRRWAAWLVWGGLVFAGVAFVQLGVPYLDSIGHARAEFRGRLHETRWEEFRIAVPMTGALLAASLVGLPFGRVAADLHGWFRRSRWRARRTRFRARRLSA